MRLFAAFVMFGFAMAQSSVQAQDAASAKMAESVIQQWPAGVVTTENKPGEWGYEEGVLLDGMAAQWHATATGADFNYIKDAVDKYVTEDGGINGYPDAQSLDDIEMGRAVLLVYRVTQCCSSFSRGV
jgi:unsaturated rhamnogalacturonyl hydrolase